MQKDPSVELFERSINIVFSYTKVLRDEPDGLIQRGAYLVKQHTPGPVKTCQLTKFCEGLRL